MMHTARSTPSQHYKFSQLVIGILRAVYYKFAYSLLFESEDQTDHQNWTSSIRQNNNICCTTSEELGKETNGPPTFGLLHISHFFLVPSKHISALLPVRVYKRFIYDLHKLTLILQAQWERRCMKTKDLSEELLSI